MPFARDNVGKFISYPDMAAMVSYLAPVPVYGTYDFYMGYGIVGGRLTSGDAQGQAAAEILLRVLGGENPSHIPITTVAPSEFQFDSRQLHRYNIAVSDLPSGSRILYLSWYELYQIWVWLGGLLVSITVLLGWGLFRYYKLERRSEAALRRSKVQLEAILNSTSESIFQIDKNGIMLAINNIAAHRLGKEPQEMLGRNAFDFFQPEVAASRRENLAEVFRTGKEMLTEDTRSDHHFQLSYYPIAGRNGKVESVVVYAVDITERKRNEIELMKSQERLKAAASAGIVGVWDWDVPNNLLEWDDVMYKLYGLRMGDFEEAYEAWARAIHPDDKARTEGEIQAALRGEREYAPEFRVVWPDGSVHYIKAASHTTFDAHGKPLRMIGINYELTEQKEIEQKLQRESEKNLAFLRNASDGINILDVNGNLIQASDSFCSMLGYERDEIIGMNVSKWDSKFKGVELTQVVNNLFAQHSRTQFETIHRRKDGSTFDVEISSLLLELEGKPVLFCSSRDITERKQNETVMRQYKKALETTHDGYWMVDSKGFLLEANQAYADIVGYTVSELRGLHVSQLEVNEQSVDEVKAHITKIISRGYDVFETRHRHKDGHEVDFEISTSYEPESQMFVAFCRDITLRKEAEKQIAHLAFYDPLTGLPNRRLLQDRLTQALSSGVRRGRKGAILFIDLDNFKTINDTLGHDIGDLLLQQAAQRIQSCLREGDTVARPGGDEFVVMLSDLSEVVIEAAAQTEAVGEKILAALSKPYLLSGRECHNTSSIGATLFGDQKQAKQAIEEIMKQADIAMYQAKNSGRNALRFFDPEMQASINSLAALEDELRTALANQDFQLYYQIQVDNSLRPLGAEALIRWIHPERGLVSPAQFIPLAEDTGQIVAIGNWVLETACAQLKAWQEDTRTCDLVLAVNVSAKQFRQADFVSQVQTVVKRYAIDPRLLKLELTESMLVSNVEETIQTMSKLREVGVRFSLDDFGTGYSSLQYLKRLPLDQVKIDQSFVRDITTDSSDKAIVRTIIAMAYSMNLDVIAEGVETEAQRQLLLKKGCKNYQGYLFGKPVPITQFEESLRKA
jgi:diguanylate cyclase (GGDEF)-like protein/PAS domain S-box-containing protein